MTRPEPLMHFVDYKNYASVVFRDIKVRWQIHQYEINKLGEDLNKVAQTIAPYVQKIMDYSVSRYQEVRDRYVTIK